MALYRAGRKGQCWYGESIGILILDAQYPCVPGNVGNASTFDFPVRYKVVKEASIERLLTKRDRSLLQPFLEAALDLQNEGVKAITGACGFMALFQRELAEHLEVPVFLSSLIQIPFICRILPRGKRVGVISADSKALTAGHFEAVGVTGEMPVTVYGMEDQPEFSQAVLQERGTLNSDLIEQEIIGVAKRLTQDYPDTGAILLECSDLPPYAQSVQREVKLPVFDFITMIRYVHSTLVRSPFSGFM